jgi:hypothetical protein
LENVKLVATSAAVAWAKEAVAAELREARQLRVRALTGGSAKPDIVTSDDLSLSENPDRGFTATKAPL